LPDGPLPMVDDVQSAGFLQECNVTERTECTETTEITEDYLARLLPFLRGVYDWFCYEKRSGLVGIMGCDQTIHSARARKLRCTVYQR
jgi:hypothetical protein